MNNPFAFPFWIFLAMALLFGGLVAKYTLDGGPWCRAGSMDRCEAYLDGEWVAVPTEAS